MIALVAALVLWGDPDPDPLKLPGEAEKAYRLGHFEAAEKELRARLAETGAEELRLAEARLGLLRVLLAARKYPDAAKEAETALVSSRDTGLKAYAQVTLAICRWKLDDPAGAKAACAEAVRLEDTYEIENRGLDPQGESKRKLEIPSIRPIVARVTGFLDWRRTATDRIVVWTPPDADADPEIAGRRLDGVFDEIAKGLGAAVEGRVEIFIFNDQRQADRILGQPGNFCVPRERLIYAISGAATSYDLVRVLSFHAASAKGKERPRTALLREGVAAAFAQEPMWKERVASLARKLQRQGLLPSLADLSKAALPDASDRSCAGSFVQFLYRKTGRESWVRLWTEFNDHEDPWTAVTGKSRAQLEDQWVKWLREESP